MTYADTSYLVSLYTIDSHTQAAIAHDQQMPDAPVATSFSLYELRNAVRLKVFRGEIDLTQAARCLADLRQDILQGAVVFTRLDLEVMVARAERLSDTFTFRSGQRGMDILHVASALILGANEFLTFDIRQGNLATQVGLKIGP